MQRAKVWALSLALVGVVWLVSGCGAGADAGGAGRATRTATATSAAPATGLGTCQPGQMTVSVVNRGVALGHTAMTVWLTNTGAAACTLDGYATVVLLDGQQRPMPTHQERSVSAYTFVFATPQPQPLPVALAGSGGRAGFLLEYSNVTSAAGETCAQTSYVGVTPPGSQDARGMLVAEAQMSPCGGTIITSPIVAAAAIGV